MNSQHLLIKSFISVRIKNLTEKSINLLFFFFKIIDWKVDGDPEHEISGQGPRVAEGALTMV